MTDPEANARIQKLLDDADAMLLRTQGVTEQRLLQAYRKTLDEVQGTIAKVFAGNENPTITEMRKLGRLASIEKQIAAEIKALTQIAVNVTDQGTKKAFMKSYTDTGAALELGTGMSLGFDKLPTDAIRYEITDNLWLDALNNSSGKLLSDVKREFETTLRTNARQEVTAGLAQGKSYREVAKAIKGRFDVAATRARMITFTEMHKGHSAGRLVGILKGSDAAGRIGLESVKVWKHNGIGDPRPGHLAADGQEVGTKEAFVVQAEKGGTFSTEAPGLSGLPEEDIYCHCSAQFQIKGLDRVNEDGVIPPEPVAPPPEPEPAPAPAPEVIAKKIKEPEPIFLSPYRLDTAEAAIARDFQKKFNANFRVEGGYAKAGVSHYSEVANAIHDELVLMQREMKLAKEISQRYPVEYVVMKGRGSSGFIGQYFPLAEGSIQPTQVPWYTPKGMPKSVKIKTDAIEIDGHAQLARAQGPSVATNGKGGFNTPSGVDTTTRHEFGHHVHFRLKQYTNEGGFHAPVAPGGMTDSDFAARALTERGSLSERAKRNIYWHTNEVPHDWMNLWLDIETGQFGDPYKGARYWKHYVAEYAAKDVREAFAVSYDIYTGHGYKALAPKFRLPGRVERYFDNLMKTKAYKPPKVKK